MPESETTRNPKPIDHMPDLIKGIREVVLGHGVMIVLALIVGLSENGWKVTDKEAWLGIGAVFLMMLPMVQLLYVIPLGIIYGVKKRWAVLGGVLLAMGFTVILSFGLCFGLLAISSVFGF